jgi:hypothetical protein
MKRLSFLILLLLLLIPLNACTTGALFGYVPPELGTAVGMTQTATVWTPTISPTPAPNQAKIVDWLNGELSGTSSLERTVDAKYQVVDANLIKAANDVAVILRVDIRCECATYDGCCTPERMFVKVMEAMQQKHDKIIEQVPESVSEIRVICYSHTTYFGAMAASWADTKSYLREEITGDQFGSRVFRSSIP